MDIRISNFTKTFKEDLLGGLAAAIIGLPMGLAFGVQSGLGPQAGLFTAIALPIIVAIFGGTRTLISDPTGPMTVVAATIVSVSLAQADSLENAYPLIIATFLLAGIFQLFFGLIDLGKYVKFMPYPVLSGFMAGIGVIIISVQLFPILGYDSPKGFVNILTNIGTPLSNVNYQALGLGALTIAIIYLLPLLNRQIPAILTALVFTTLLATFLELNVPLIGEIPRELPPFRLFELTSLQFSDFYTILVPALMLSGLGVIDTLLTSVVADNITNTKHNSKRTIIGQGVGNIVTALFGGLPGAGATMGTVTNIKSGATSRLSGLAKGLFLLTIVVAVAEYVQYIPSPVLAGILITIGIGIIDFKGIKLLLKVPRQDAVVWAVVLLVTLFDNLLDAVGIGFVLSAIFFIGKMSRTLDRTLRGATIKNMPYKSKIPAMVMDKIHVKQLEGPLFFGFANAFREECQRVDDVLAVILHFKYVPFLDQSGLLTLESVISDWQQRGIQVYLAGANELVLDSLKKVELVPSLISKDNCFDYFDDCVAAISNKVKNAQRLEHCEVALLDQSILSNRQKLVAV
ncbi:MAG: SulP family inorganic anion transporter [Bacteroidota bacterium]